MPTIGHMAVGIAAARLTPAEARPSSKVWTALLVTLSLLPDADVVAFSLGIPYSAPFGHRGATHSLVFALLVGLICGAVAAARRRRWLTIGVVTMAVVASHGVLDTFTDGGLGAALLWPFSDARYFAPWRPIPVAPIGARMLSSRGLTVVLTEAVLFLPILLVGLWPGRRR